jgi:phage recombination protein Bet
LSNDLINTEFEANGEKVKLDSATVAQYLVRGNEQVTKQEVVMFINLCKYQKLNPFLNEAYLIKFKGAPAQIIVSKEAFMKRAEANDQYDGMEAGIIVEREGQMVDLEGAIKLPEDKLIGGWARVFRKDRSLPIKSRISLEEFSKGQSTWKSMPLNMIRKTAIVNAMREAFPASLGAMYTEEETNELPDGNVQKINQEIKQKANTQIIDVEFQEAPEVVDPSQEEPLKQQSLNGPGF